LLPVQYYESVAGGSSPSGEFKLFYAILEMRCATTSRPTANASAQETPTPAKETLVNIEKTWNLSAERIFNQPCRFK
jgi:hypothetical protein